MYMGNTNQADGISVADTIAPASVSGKTGVSPKSGHPEPKW